MSYNRDYYFSRPLVLLGHGAECWLCGVVSPLLEVHHVDKNTQNNSLYNLCPLCPSCHKISHKMVFVFDIKKKPLIANKIDELEQFRCFYYK